MVEFLKSRGLDAHDEEDEDEGNKQKQPQTEPEIMSDSDNKLTPVVIETPVIIDSTKNETGTTFKEGMVKKKAAMFRDEGDDNKSRYRP